jgi:hypothetical protein
MACISLSLSRVPFSLFDLRSPKLVDLAIAITCWDGQLAS